MCRIKQIIVGLVLFMIAIPALSQELQAKITINHNQIQGTDASVFENLQTTLEQFVNDHQWTSLQFQKNERIFACGHFFLSTLALTLLIINTFRFYSSFLIWTKIS